MRVVGFEDKTRSAAAHRRVADQSPPRARRAERSSLAGREPPRLDHSFRSDRDDLRKSRA